MPNPLRAVLLLFINHHFDIRKQIGRILNLIYQHRKFQPVQKTGGVLPRGQTHIQIVQGHIRQ